MVTSVAQLMLSARYTGAVPLRDRKTKHDSLKAIRFGIRSQWCVPVHDAARNDSVL